MTNKELRHTQRVLEATGLAAQFDLVVGGDSLPEKKPHASVLRHVLQRLGATAERSAHLGDSATDIAAARNAGVAAWAVPWAYNAGRAIADARPDRIFASFAEVAAHMLQAQRWPPPLHATGLHGHAHENRDQRRLRLQAAAPDAACRARLQEQGMKVLRFADLGAAGQVAGRHGGGAFLEVLEGKTLPAFEILERRAR